MAQFKVGDKVIREDSGKKGVVVEVFEAGKEKVGKNGVVRDPKVHEEVLHGILSFCKNHGFAVLGLTYSPIKGPEGNIEFLLDLVPGENATKYVSYMNNRGGTSFDNMINSYQGGVMDYTETNAEAYDGTDGKRDFYISIIYMI